MADHLDYHCCLLKMALFGTILLASAGDRASYTKLYAVSWATVTTCTGLIEDYILGDTIHVALSQYRPARLELQMLATCNSNSQNLAARKQHTMSHKLGFSALSFSKLADVQEQMISVL